MSKAQCRVSVEDIPIMHPFTNFDSTELDDDEDFANDVSLNNHDGGKLEKTLENRDGDPMAKRLILIEKQNWCLMKLMSQLPVAPTPSIVEHPDGYAASPFVEVISKTLLPKKLNLPVLTATYDASTDPVEYVAQYKQRIW